jgi:hypothetical protein
MLRTTSPDALSLRRSALRTAGVIAGCSITLAAAGCGGDDTETRGIAQLGVSKSDLPNGYKRTSRRVTRSAQTCLGVLPSREIAAIAKLGIVSCAQTAYIKRSGTGSGLNSTGSTVVLLKSKGDASAAMRAIRSGLRSTFTVTGGDVTPATLHSLPASGLGDERPRGIRARSRGVGETTGDHVAVYLYVWRRGKAAVVVGSSNVIGDFDAKSTLTLAMKVDDRMTDELD